MRRKRLSQAVMAIVAGLLLEVLFCSPSFAATHAEAEILEEPTDGRIPVVSASANRWQEPNVPTNTIDDDLGTRWSCENDRDPDCYIVFDLGSVTRVEIAFLRGDERMALFGLEASLNGTTSSGTTLQLEPFSVAMQAQYHWYTGQGNTANKWLSVTEFHAYGAGS